MNVMWKWKEEEVESQVSVCVNNEINVLVGWTEREIAVDYMKG